MDIRRATEADVDMMRRLWDEFTAEATFTPYPGSPFEPALLADHIALVAEEDGEAVGTVYSNLSSPHFGFVFGLYTRPPARGRGVGRALMRSIAATLRDEGRRYVVLSVDAPNEAARAFYDRLGFVDHARVLRVDVEDLLGG
jgi:ribosomal protein S18 acetylase RimI-like enzyme